VTPSPRRVLLTGAGGLIGRQCIDELNARGYEVHGVSHHSPAPADVAHWHRLDLTDHRTADRLVRDVEPSHLLHLGWRSAHGDIWNSPENLRWVDVSARLFAAFRGSGGQRAVGVGSCAEYDWRFGTCQEDLTPLSPRTYYGACKSAVREALLGLSRVTELSTAWGRVFFVFGPAEHPDRVVASVVSGLLKGERVAVTHGRQIRDYMHSADVAGALVALLDSDAEGAFNVASGRPITVADLIATTADLIGRPELIEFGARPAQNYEPPIILGTTDKLRDAVGWELETSLKERLEQTVEWWTAHLADRAR
jgi:UDP-glucuronate decarboxylase